MPDKEVKTIQDLIFYQYAKIIAKSAMKTGDNETAKKKYYGFIKKTFRELRDVRQNPRHSQHRLRLQALQQRETGHGALHVFQQTERNGP